MGALQKIRSKSTLLVGIIAVGLLAFVVPWGEITQFMNVAKDKAFVVDGEVVKTRHYSQRIEIKEELEKGLLNIRTGGRVGQLNEMQHAQVREEVFQNMVNEILLGDQADRIGLAVTDAELNDITYGMEMSPVLFQVPYFIDPQTQQFSRPALNEFLSIINADYSNDPAMKARQQELQQVWAYVENRMRNERLEEKYASLVAGCVLVNDIEAKAYFEESNNVADLVYVSQKYNTIADSAIQVTDVDIQDLYNIKKENFLSKYPSRHITYLLKEVIPSEADYEDVQKQMEEIRVDLSATENPALVVNQYSARQYVDAFMALNSIVMPEVKNFIQNSSVGDIYGPVRGDRAYTMYKYVDKTVAPDSVRISMIPIQSFDPTLASVVADSLQTVLKGGKGFQALAQEMYPNIPGVGTAEWYTEIDLLGAGIAEQCFKASKGSIIKVEMNGMTGLVKIEDLTKPVTKVKIADVTMPVIVSDKTNNSIDNEINKFMAENKNSAEFAKAALNAGYNVVADAIVYPNNPSLDNIPSTRDIIRWAFNSEKLNEVKKFDTADARIVAMVTSETSEGYLPATMKEVKDVLTAEIIRNKKAEKIISDLSSKDLKSLPALAESLDVNVDTVKFVTFQANTLDGVGYEPVLNAYGKVGKVNVVSSPLKGNAGVYLVNVLDRKIEGQEFDSAQVKRMLQGNYSQLLQYSATYALTNKMDVFDNRIKFY